MNPREILPLLESAFQELFGRDGILFDLGAEGISEQSVTFRLGLYLQCRFGDHHVDCEYNRWGTKKKTDENVDLDWMKPDVLVHVRTIKEENLLVIEAKKSGKWAAGWHDTEQKLKAFTRKPGNYEYRLGMAWKIRAQQDPANHEAVWFCDGSELCRTSVVNFVAVVSEAIDAKNAN
jgi:hypothetical protein